MTLSLVTPVCTLTICPQAARERREDEYGVGGRRRYLASFRGKTFSGVSINWDILLFSTRCGRVLLCGILKRKFTHPKIPKITK